jgi:alkanesulfonate monooxygenase SsuD/methylene tetrahydromethanopterin reductase-like flavin-dependent oxidoreductase (luciferase family)
MASLPDRDLEVGLILPTWTALPPDSQYWLSLELPFEKPNWTSFLALARQAEAAGFTSLWTFDQLLYRMDAIDAQYGLESPTPGVPGPDAGFWECWSVLAALAAVTQRVEIGSMVTCSSYRNPALLAKIAATVDDISGGRVILGIGAGGMEEEHASHGMRWDHRVSRFAEAIEIIHALLKTGTVDFDGEYYQITNGELLPRPARPGGPPILIGALEAGPRMMDLAARYADIWTGWIGFGRSHPDWNRAPDWHARSDGGKPPRVPPGRDRPHRDLAQSDDVRGHRSHGRGHPSPERRLDPHRQDRSSSNEAQARSRCPTRFRRRGGRHPPGHRPHRPASDPPARPQERRHAHHHPLQPPGLHR